MKAKTGFNLREVCGEKIIVAEGKENIDFSNIISMNESSAFLWGEIQEREFTAEDLVDKLCEQYEVDRETAAEDVAALVEQWAKAGIIEGEDVPEVETEAEKQEPTAEIPVAEPETKKRKGLLGKLFGK